MQTNIEKIGHDKHFLYERFVESYEKIFSIFLTQSYEDAKIIIQTLKPKSILEVGIGPGSAFHVYPKESQVLGIDPSESMLVRARQKKADYPHIQVEQMDGQSLSLADNSFDLLTSFSVVTVVPDPNTYLRELIRVVKPGGYILLTGHFEKKSLLSQTLTFATNYLTRRLLGFRMDLKESILLNFESEVLIKQITPTNQFAGCALSSLVLMQKKSV